MARPCKYTLKNGKVLDFTQARQYVMDNIDELAKQSPTLKAKYDAITKGKVEESGQPEYKEGDTGREAPKTGSSNRPVTSSIVEEETKKTDKEKLAEQIAAEVEGMPAQKEKTYTERAKRYSDKLRRLAENSEKKFYDEEGNQIKLNTNGFTMPELLNKVADVMDTLGSIADDIVRLKEAINQVLSADEFSSLSDRDKLSVTQQLFDKAVEMFIEPEKRKRNVRQSRIINRMITGGSLSNEQIANLMPSGEGGVEEGNMRVPDEDPNSKPIEWNEEAVSIEETQEIIDDLLDMFGYDKMMDVANATNIATWFRVLLAGRINDQFYRDEQKAATEFEKQLARDKAYKMISVIESIGKEAGRTLRFIREVYKQSPIAYAQYQKNNIDIGEFGVKQHNENEKIANEIADLFNGKKNKDTTPKQEEENRKQDAQESMTEAADQVFEDEEKTKEDVLADLEAQVAGIDEDIAALEAQIAAEKEARKNAKKPGKGGIGGAINSSVRNVLGMNSPSELQQKLNELKAKKKEIQNKIESMKEAPKPAKENEPQKEKEKATASEKLAKRILDRTKDKKVKETDVEKMLIDELFSIAKGITPKGMNPNQAVSPLQRLKDAILNFDEYRRTWDSARAEVEDKIDRMRISPQEKADMKQALEEYFETELEVPFSKATATKFSKEAATNRAISKMIDTYAEMGIDLSLAEDEVVEKIAFSLGLTDQRAIDAFRDIVQERFEEINNRKLDAKAKRDAQNAAIKEAKERSKEAEYRERSRTGGSNQNVWQKRREALAKALGKRMAEGLVGKSAKQKTLMDEFAEKIRRTILSNTSPIIKAKKEDIKKKSSIELLGDILNNMDEYKAVVAEAQAQLAEKYKDNPAALLLLDDAMFGLTEMSFTNKAAQGSVKEAMIAAGYSKRVGGKDVIDWKGIIGDSETQEQAKQAIYEKVKEVIGEDAANKVRAQIDAVYNQMVAKKKIEEINKILKAYGRPATKRSTPASTIYKINRLINLNGGVIGANIQSAIGNLIGTTRLTPTQSARITQLSQAYFDAKPGFERRQALERMTNYIRYISKGKAWYAVASINQHFVNGMISGLVTTAKNITVGGDLIGTLLTDYARSGLDSNVLKLAFQSLKEGGSIFNTVFFQGYSGRTLSALDVEMQGKEKVNPRLAEFAYDLTPGMRGEKVFNAVRNIWDSAKYTSRLNEGVDSIFGSVSANVAKYNIMKDIYKKQGMTSKQAAQAAYQALYITPQIMEDAMDEARQEYADRGINPTESRVKRRAYEIIDKQRVNQVDKDGTEVKKMADEAANQLTYKSPGIKGITHALAFVVNGINKALDAAGEKKWGGNKKTNKLAATGTELIKLFVNNIAPFANVGANVTEGSLDRLPVYGTAKWAIGKFKLRRAIENDPTGDNTVRLKVAMRTLAAKQVTSITLGALLAVAYLLAGDDEEEEFLKMFDIVKGTGGKYVRKNIIPAEDKGRSLGNIPMDFLGTWQTALLLLADYKQAMQDNPDTDEKTVAGRTYEHMVAIKDAFFTAVLSQSVMRGIADLADFVSNFETTSASKYAKKKSAALIVNATLPAIGMAKQVGDITSPVKKEAIDYVEYLMNEGGTYSTWAVDRTKFDWRGREYATGDLYASNSRSIAGLEPILKADAIDKWAMEKKIKTTTPKTEYDIAELEEDRQIFALVPDTVGPNMLLDEYQNYEFRKEASEIFDRKLRYLWSYERYRQALNSLSKEDAQKVVNELWSDSKLESLYNMNKKVSPNIMASTYPTIEDYKKRNKRFEAIKSAKQLQDDLDIKEGITNEKLKINP
jgi:hypothetical protein